MRADARRDHGDDRRRAILRLLALLAALLALLNPPAMARTAADALLEKAGIGRLEALSEAVGGPNAREIAGAALAGNLDFGADMTKRLLRRCGKALRGSLLRALSALAVPVLVSLVLRMVLGPGDGAMTLLCRLSCVCALARQSAEAICTAEVAMRASAQIARRAAPVVAAVLALTGKGAAAATLTPLSALCVDAIESALIAFGLPMCLAAAAIAAGGSLSEGFRLDRLFALICRCVVWSVRLALAAFVGLLAVQGRLAAAKDAASGQALQQALKGLIPYVGGSVSDSSGALAQSALAVRNAVGVTGMLIALGAAVKPVLGLGAHMLSLKLASAVIEPVADPAIARIAASYGEIARLLLALCVGSAMLAALLVGTAFGLVGF